MKKLRAAVIGLGMGKGHIRGYQSHPDCEVVAIADPNTERLETVRKEMNIPSVYESAEEMLKKEKLDLVSVATPNRFHHPLTLAALKAGCHVLCEKPMAMTAKLAREMNQAAKKAKKRLMINLSYRFTEAAWALKKEVDDGVLGDVYFAKTMWLRRRGLPGFGGWFGQKKLSGGGPLIDLGVHRLDLALWLMGYPKPVWVMGGAYNPIATKLAKEQKKEYDVEDLAVGMVRFDNGAMLEVEASWAANMSDPERMETRLFGTKGGLLHHNGGSGYDQHATLSFEKNGCQYNMDLQKPVPGACSPYYHFVDSIAKNKPHIATGDEGLIVQEILDALYKSAEKGKPLQIK